MKIIFAGSFKKSLNKFIWQQTRIYKTYEYCRYDLPNFFRNVWLFRKELTKFFWWDYTGMLMLMKRSLDTMSSNLEIKGNEIDETRLKKVQKMRRAAELLNNIINDNFIEQAENTLKKKVISSFDFSSDDFKSIELTENDDLGNRNIFELSTKIEEDQTEELLSIFKGPDMEEFKKLVEKNPGDHGLWTKFYDGSGFKHWWD
jgi:hypothetical protein